MSIAHINGVDVVHWNPRRAIAPGRLGLLLPKGKPINNFGDLIGPMIVERLAPRASIPHRGARLLSVGSILHFAQDRDVVWGSGINGKVPNAELRFSNLDVRAVRGPRTAAVLESRGINVPRIFGDPALLMPRLFPELFGVPKSQARTVVPNLHDFEALRNRDDVLDPRLPIEVCVKAIASSEYVVASSLHGIILAEAAGVPVGLLKPSVESMFKYEDYFEGTGRSLPRISATVRAAEANPTDGLRDWSEVELLESFPSDLWLDRLTHAS